MGPHLKRYQAIPILLLLVVVTGCGGSDPAPTPIPTATTVPTLPPGTLSVADLIDRTDAAFAGITSMQSTFWSTEAASAGTPPATGLVTVEQVVLPANRHVTQLTNGQVTDEQLVVDGRVYMKGALVPAAIAPMVDTATWIEVDPAAAVSDSPIAMQVAYLLSPTVSPFAGVSDETRALAAIPAGEVTIDGRTCQRYTFGDATGDSGIGYELLLDEDDLPCRLVQSAGGYVNVTTYAFNVPGLVLVAPSIATPAAP
jgi:hypothetical protein